MKHLIIGLLTFSITFITSCDAQGLKTPSVKVTVKVMEEDGTPIMGARASFSGGLGTLGKRQASGFTAAPNGEFTDTIASQEGLVRASAEKQGYYHNGTDYQSVQGTSSDPFKSHREGRWDGGDQIIDIILRPIKNPVPMKAKKIEIKLPADSTWVGYDLDIGDMVSPYGKGRIADIEFYGKGTWESSIEYDGNLTIRIPGIGNGIVAYDIPKMLQYCQFKSPYAAPEDGYLSEWTWREMRTTKNREFSEIHDESFPNRMFIFRVRAETDGWGRVVKAQYGKIYGPVEIFPRNGGIGLVKFTYYLNPDYTRNLEFDPKQNLFRQEPGKGREYNP